MSPSLRFITRVHSRSGSETESSTDYSDSTSSTHTKVRAKRFKRRSERLLNSSQIGESSESYAKRNVSSSNEQTVDMEGTRHNHHVKQRKESFHRTGDCGGRQQRNNLSIQTKLAINKNTGLTFIRPYDEVCGNNEIIENNGASTNLINRKGTLKNDSYTRFSESSESDRSDGIADISQNQHSVIYNIKSTRLNQIKCVLVDYSKLLKSRDSIVKPLPRNTKVKNTLEEIYCIKEKLRIDSEMKKRAKRRSQLEVWT